jgi:uncharacterized protein YcfJ
MDRPSRWSGALAAGLMASSLSAGEVLYDYAEVTSVQPVIERSRTMADASTCQLNDREVKVDVTGSSDEGVGIAGLADLIREELDVVAHAECRARPEETERIVGYRVTYRYADSEYTRWVKDDPGPRLKVVVRLEPAP